MWKYWLQVGFGCIGLLFGAGFKYLNNRIKQTFMEQKAIKNGIQAMLRDRIIQVYHHQREKGNCPLYVLENIELLYKEYSALGGNGLVKMLVHELRELAK